MIYECPKQDSPIRQGDIFIGLPRVDFSLQKILVLNEKEEIEKTEWKTIAQTNKPITAIVTMKPVAAIVATQDCDASRARDITLCEIKPFCEVERKAKDTQTSKGWKNILTQHARINIKWFYLPPDLEIGFDKKMAVDFMVTLRLPREELEELRELRKGRLNNLADEHFRERIAEFFRRYPYDEWYPLDQDELKIYMNEYPDITPFPWQNDCA